MTGKKRILFIVSSGVLLLTAAMSAMLSSSDETTNSFLSGNFDIAVEEPAWTGPYYNIVPNQELEKDPRIVNKGEIEAFVFAEVTVPYSEEAITEEIEGGGASRKSIPAVKFICRGKDPSYDSSDTTAQIVNDGWIQVGSPLTDAENETCTYVFAYVGSSGDEMEVLPPYENNVTPPLFDAVRFCNAREDRAETVQAAEGRTMNIRVNGCGIQTEYLRTEQGTETDPETVWAALQSGRSGS